jgi:pilus assembly protein CpaE
MLVLVAATTEGSAREVADRVARYASPGTTFQPCEFREAEKSLLSEPQRVDVALVVCPPQVELARVQIQQMRSLCTGVVVAVMRGLSASDVVQLVRCGASDIIDLDGDVDNELRHLVARLERGFNSQRRCFTTGVVAASGGAGATVIAANLAVSLAQQNRSVCLIDLHPRGGDQSILFNLPVKHSLTDLCAQGGHRLDAVMFEQALINHESGVKLLATDAPLGERTVLDLESFGSVIRNAKSTFDQLVIDLEDVFHREQTEAVTHCDRLLIVVRVDFASILRTRRLLDSLRSMGVSDSNLRLVANRIGRTPSISPHKIKEALGLSIEHWIPDDPAAVISSINVGNPLVRENHRSPAAKAIHQLAATLAG